MTESAFVERLEAHDVSPLWAVMANLVTETPQPKAAPYLWNYSVLRRLLMEAGERVTAEEAERRVLILENPGDPGTHTATDALYAGLQLVLPGEIAPVHRHTQSALRFVFESEGAWTSVDGEKVEMQPYDLVLTANWRWHEHGGADRPAVWLDGLDIPIVQHFSAGFAERAGNVPASSAVPAGTCLATYGSNLRPVSVRTNDNTTPLFHFPFKQWFVALQDYSGTCDPDPHVGWMMEFTNPVDGGAVMGTISAFCQKVVAGGKTKARRQSAGAVYAGVGGHGVLIIDEAAFEVGPRDIVVVPSWCALEIKAGDEDLVLFSYSDRTCHEKLGFWREERL